MSDSKEKETRLPRLTTFQLFNLCAGIIGIQFTWSMQIALSNRVLEPLGANPFLYGLIWCAGPITGLLVQPIVGAISDKTWTRIGRRRPFLLVGAFLGAIALIFFPFSPYLWVAVLFIWIIDACVNISQGPYRALVPDNVPPEQHPVANAYINFAFGAGSVIALSVAPILRFFDIQMTIGQQYIMAAIAFLFFIIYTSLTIREYPKSKAIQDSKKKESILTFYKKFLKADREIHKICLIQLLTWMGIMCMFIYLTPYTVHYVYHIPDLSTKEYKQIEHQYETLNPIINEINSSDKLSDNTFKQLNTITNRFNNVPDVKQTIKTTLSKGKISETQRKMINSEETTLNNHNKELNILIKGLLTDPEIYQNKYRQEIKSLAKKSTEKSTLTNKIQTSTLDNKTQKSLLNLVEAKELFDYQTMLIQYSALSNTFKNNNITLAGKINFESESSDLQKLSTMNRTLEKEMKEKISEKLVKKQIFKYQKDSITTLPAIFKKFLTIDNYRKIRILDLEATNTAQSGLVAFNLISLILSIPIGYICLRTGKKIVYSVSLLFMVGAFACAPLVQSHTGVITMMAFAGVAWATILSIPYSYLCDHMVEGEEGAFMGIFNLFIAGPQLISATIVGWIISQLPMMTPLGETHNWSIAFLVGAGSILLSIIAFQFIKDEQCILYKHFKKKNTGINS
jgi:MFS family permease